MDDLSFTRYMVHEISIVRPAMIADRYGDLVPDWTAPASVHALGWLTSQTTTEVTDGREAISSEWELSLPAGTDIEATDRVEAHGAIHEIVGDVSPAPTPDGTHHLVVRLRTVRG